MALVLGEQIGSDQEWLDTGLGRTQPNLRRSVWNWAMASFAKHKRRHAAELTKNIVTVIDYSLSDEVERLWTCLFDDHGHFQHLARNHPIKVAHGRGSIDWDAYNDASRSRAEREAIANTAVFASNTCGSNRSSVGAFAVLLERSTTAGNTAGRTRRRRAVELMGLDVTNDAAHDRHIIMHGADYVRPDSTGHSHGCPAISDDRTAALFLLIRGGSFLYSYLTEGSARAAQDLLPVHFGDESAACTETERTLDRGRRGVGRGQLGNGHFTE